MALTASQALMIDAFERLRPTFAGEMLEASGPNPATTPEMGAEMSSSSSLSMAMPSDALTGTSHPSSQRARTRKRSFEACDSCRRSKTRCESDLDGVCFRCRATGRECVFGDTYAQYHPQAPASSNPYHLPVVGQSFGHAEMLCLRAYKKVQANIPLVSTFEISCGILKYSELVHNPSTRAGAFACRSAAWAAITIGAIHLDRDYSCYLDNAMQGLSGYYDYPGKESTSALVAICDVAMCDKRVEIISRCLSVLDVLTHEQPPSPVQAAFLWFICYRASREAGLSPDQMGTLMQRINPPDIDALPRAVQVTTKIASLGMTMLDTLADNLSAQDKLRQCSEAYEALDPISRSLPADHLLTVFTYEIQAYFLFRMGRVRMAVERFIKAVEYLEEKNGFGFKPLKWSLHRVLLRLVEFLGGYAWVVERSRTLVRKATSVPWYKESPLFDENRVVSELLRCLLAADRVL